MVLEIPITHPVLQLTIVLAIALLVQSVAKRLSLPGLVGVLIAGMVLGPGGLHLLPREPVVDLMGSVGLIYVMFMAGLDIDMGVARKNMQETISLGIASFIIPLIAGAGTGLLLGWNGPAALLLGALISSHTLLAYPVIQRLGLLSRRSVVAVVGGTLLTDTLALVLLAVVMQWQTEASQGQLGGFAPLALLLVLVVLSLLVIPRATRWVLKTRASQAEKALYVLVVLLVLSSIADLIGTEKILGAFLAGVCFNNVLSQRDVLHDHVEFVGSMLFIPIFFISTGMLLDVSVFTQQHQVWVMAGILVGLVVGGKTVAAWLVGQHFGYGLQDRLLMISLTLPQAAATLAITMTAYQAGIFEEILLDAVIVLIFITCLVGPLLTQYSGRRVPNGKYQESATGTPQSPRDRGR